MRCHQPTAIGKHGVGTGQLQRRDLHHGLTDRRTGHVLRNPGNRPRFRPATTRRGPGLIAHQSDTFLPADLNAGLLLKAQLISRPFQRLGPRTDSHLIEKGIAGETQGIGIPDMAKSHTVVIGEAMAAVGDAGRGVQFDVRWKLS